MKAVSDNVNFGAGGGTLELLQPGKQSGDIAGFSSGDTISLHGSWLLDTLTNPTSGTTDLTLISGKGATHTFDFTGHVHPKRVQNRFGAWAYDDGNIQVTTKKERGSTCAARAGFSPRYSNVENGCVSTIIRIWDALRKSAGGEFRRHNQTGPLPMHSLGRRVFLAEVRADDRTAARVPFSSGEGREGAGGREWSVDGAASPPRRLRAAANARPPPSPAGEGDARLARTSRSSTLLSIRRARTRVANGRASYSLRMSLYIRPPFMIMARLVSGFSRSAMSAIGSPLTTRRSASASFSTTPSFPG